MFRAALIQNLKGRAMMARIETRTLMRNRIIRNYFSDKNKEDEERMAETQSIFDKIKLNQDELKKSPLEKNTLKKLSEPYGKDVKLRLKEEWEYYQRVKKRNQELETEIKSINTVCSKNKEAVEKLKTMVQEEKEEGARIATRLKKEIEKEKTFAVSKFSIEILEVIDNIERLIQNCQVENTTQTYQGIEVIYNSSLNVLKRFGIQKIPSPLSQQVDLDFHDIVFHAPYPGKPDGEVLDVSQTGYVIGERVLRPTKVGVVKNM